MTLDELFRRWAEVRKGLYAGLDQVTDAQLTFAPREGLWSLGVTALHIASAEEGWVRFVVQHVLDGWPSDEAFGLVRYPSVAAVKAALPVRSLRRVTPLDWELPLSSSDIVMFSPFLSSPAGALSRSRVRSRKQADRPAPE